MTPKEMMDFVARRYQGGRERLFIVHGNVGDLMPLAQADGTEKLYGLPDYFWRSSVDDPKATDRRIFVHYALRFGPRWMNGAQSGAEARIARLMGTEGEQKLLFSKKPLDFLGLIEEVCRRKEKVGDAKDAPERVIPLRVVATDAHLIVPDATPAMMRPEDRDLLVLLKRFATDPAYDETNTIIVLVTDVLSGIHRELREVAVTIELTRPSEKEMAEYLPRAIVRTGVSVLMADETRLPRLATGLSRRQVENVLAETRAAGDALSADTLARRRKELTSRDYSDLLEFYESTWKLDDVGASRLAVSRIWKFVERLRAGSRKLPAGIILAGQNGIGKTFIGKALFGSAGITCVLMKSLQDSPLGASERNWEKVATALKSGGQIGVLVDEAHNVLGQTAGPNVHEVSKKLFSAQMQIIGDPELCGKIFWVLMTSRPDKLSPDVKRPGRCNVVIPLFPLITIDDVRDILRAQIGLLTRKGEYKLAPEFLSGEYAKDEVYLKRFIGRTGGQIEDMFKKADEYADGAVVTREHLERVFAAEVLWDAEPEAYEMQRLIGIAEAVETKNAELVPEYYRDEVQKKYGSLDKVKERIEELRHRLDH